MTNRSPLSWRLKTNCGWHFGYLSNLLILSLIFSLNLLVQNVDSQSIDLQPSIPLAPLNPNLISDSELSSFTQTITLSLNESFLDFDSSRLSTSINVNQNRRTSSRCTQVKDRFSLNNILDEYKHHPDTHDLPLVPPELALTSSISQFDLGREILNHDIIYRSKSHDSSESLLATAFFIEGHCPAPFSLEVQQLLSSFGLGIDEFGHTVSCSSLTDCEQCYKTTGCHYCQDSQCHAMGSYYGCIYGASCEGAKDPCVRHVPTFKGVGNISFTSIAMMTLLSAIIFLFIWVVLYLGLVCGMPVKYRIYHDDLEEDEDVATIAGEQL